MRALAAFAVVALAAACDVDRPAVPIDRPEGAIIRHPGPLRRPVDALDLLFVIDNAPGMADHQAELARRVPETIAALTDPTIDPTTGRPRGFASVNVGVITSSLGSHGTSLCAPSRTNAHDDDHAWLLPRAGEASCAGASPGQPITWVRDPSKAPNATLHGDTGALALGESAACVLRSVGDDGCAASAPWEAAYRFLVDPAPYVKAEVKCTFDEAGDRCGANKIEVTGLDESLLVQRARFLRPDSVLAVVLVSDKNDASLKPAGLNWLPWAYPAGDMMRGWPACANVPDHFEPDTPDEFVKLHEAFRCFSCFETLDAGCKVPWATDPRNADVDARSLRAFQQVQRFGYNFLHGRQRYVDALREASLVGADGRRFANPIFRGGVRDPSMVVVATIVGVPPGLVADADGTAKKLTAEDWSTITGPIGRRDPHMIESIAPRDGVVKSVEGVEVDPVHGGDRDVLGGDALQTACSVHRLGSRVPAKAWPGLRHLRIAEGLGESAYVASICEPSLRPAMLGLAKAVMAPLAVDCMWSGSSQGEDGSVSCLMLEVLAEDPGGSCEALGPGVCTPGAAPCRVPGSEFPPTDPTTTAEALRLAIPVTDESGFTGTETTNAVAEAGNVYAIGSDGKRHLVCELMQLAGGRVPQAVTAACVGDRSWSPVDVGGWCYSTDPDVVGETCAKRGAPATVRFFGAARRRPGSEVHAICVR